MTRRGYLKWPYPASIFNQPSITYRRPFLYLTNSLNQITTFDLSRQLGTHGKEILFENEKEIMKSSQSGINRWSCCGHALADGAIYLYGVGNGKHSVSCFRATFKNDTKQLENYVKDSDKNQKSNSLETLRGSSRVVKSPGA